VHLQMHLPPLHLLQRKVRRKLMLRLSLSPWKLLQQLADLILSLKKKQEAMLAHGLDYYCQVC